MGSFGGIPVPDEAQATSGSAPQPPQISPGAKPGPYITKLPPAEEQAFQTWVKNNNIPFDPSPTADYDMRGYWQANRGKMTGTQVSAFDNQLHFPDTFKTPYHATFSNESKYATPNAPHWVGNRLISKDGQVIADETPGTGMAGGSFGGVPVGDETPTSTTNTSPIIQPSASIGIAAVPQPTTVAGKIQRWAENVANDIRDGTDLTGVGTVLQKMGAHGVYNGQPHAVGDFMASLPLGLAQMTQGGAQVAQGQLVQGAGNVLGGAAEASKIPSLLTLGPALGKTVDAIDAVIPSAARAAGKFQDVMGAAKNIPIDITKPGNAALDFKALSDAGHGPSPIINKFISRVTNPNLGPMTYDEARNFYTAASGKLAPEQAMKLTGQARWALARFTAALGDSIEGATAQVGKLAQYQSAMAEYHRAMQVRAVADAAKDLAKNKLIRGAAGAVGFGAGASLVEKALK